VAKILARVKFNFRQDDGMKLFAFYVGGNMTTSNVELHDMRFAVGEKAEDCHESLRRQWWGTPESLPIDCWCELTHGDGHAITLRAEPFRKPERLFFANLGGYDAGQFTELHHNVYVVATDKAAAKKRALETVKPWLRAHRDTLFEVEHLLGLDEIAAVQGLHIHLQAAPDSPPPRFVTGCYTLLNPPPGA
jgi:hypothetical protein